MRVVPLGAFRDKVSFAVAVGAVERGFRALGLGEATLPDPMVMELPAEQAEVHVKGAHLKGGRHVVLKVATGFYKNRARGLPSGDGLFLLLDAETGIPDVLLEEHGYLTDLRTAAAVALTLRYLAPKDAKAALLIGAGALARLTARAMIAEMPLARAVPQGEPLERHFRDHGAGGEARQGAGADQQRRLRVLGREIPERERHRRGGAQVGQVAVLLEQDVGDTRLRVEQQEQSISRRQPARAVLVEPGRDLEDDVTPALEVRSLHVHLGLLCGELHHHRIGERGFAQTEGPESPLDRAHGDGEGDLVPKRPERDDPHVSR